MKKFLIAFAAIVVATLVFYACSKDLKDDSPSVTSDGGPPGSSLGVPILACGTSSTAASIQIILSTGATGAQAGFSIQWMLKSEYVANGNAWPASSEIVTTSSFCKASFSGVPGCSNYNLAPGENTKVDIGDLTDDCGVSGGCGDLLCGTEYVFRAFAHNVPGGLNKSGFSETITCSTSPCYGPPGHCTYTQVFWKTHGPIPTGNNVNLWPVHDLMLGLHHYTEIQIQHILDLPAVGDGLISLAHQLIAAKLNIANGADGTAIAATIEEADILIGPLPIPGGFLSPGMTHLLISTLTSFNEGLIGPGQCRP
jgi:hypothetical protein